MLFRSDKPEGSAQGAPSLAINFSQQDNKILQVNDKRSYGSEVERRLQEDLKDNTNLLSILSVLQRSGAMSTALHGELVSDESDYVADTSGEPAAVSVVNIQSQPVMVEPIMRAPAAFEEGI